MALLADDQEFVILNCIDTSLTEPEEDHGDEFIISTAEIDRLDLSSFLDHHTIKIKANRNRLMEHSSYFRGLLSGSFSESTCNTLSIHWNRESFLSVLKFIFGYSVEIMPDSFVLIYEAALFFGVEMLISKCQMWFAEVTSLAGVEPPKLHLDSVIHIWKYCVEHANEFIPQLCTTYLARNFMWVISRHSFSDIPRELLIPCIEHPDLTVESEKDLCDAILVWLAANSEPPEILSSYEDDVTNMLKQIHASILPLWFSAGKRRCDFFSEYAEKSIHSILAQTRQPSMNSLDIFGAGDLCHLKIRLTKYTKKVDLAGCPQLKPALILLSIIPSSSYLDHILKKGIKQSSVSIDHLIGNNSQNSWASGKILSFKEVQEVDISNCPMLLLEEAIECFRRSFPSLRLLKAAHFLNFRTSKLHRLLQKCPLLSDVDLTVDISPVIPTEVSILFLSPASAPEKASVSLSVAACHWTEPSPNLGKTQLSNLTKLTLEGRSDVSDVDLNNITEICPLLSYLNIKGCISITDAGLSVTVVKCLKLHSLLACHTSFGQSSVLSLCSSPIPAPGSERNFCPLAKKLQTLHIGGCKGVEEAFLCQLMSQTDNLKSLRLKGTQLVDRALYSFPGSSLEFLDVCDTKVSGPALAHIVCKNSGLKFLKVRGCNHLLQEESEIGRGEFSTSLYNCKELYSELGKSCKLEELALGWGFSFFSLEALRPALGTLKSLVVGLGGSLGQNGLELLPMICPLLETLVLYFQAISDSLRSIMESLTHLRVLALCYCFGEISSLSLKFCMPHLRILKLERVAGWMTNGDLVILTQNCPNLIELSLLGCTLLDSDAQDIISSGWPGLVSIHLEDCGQVTSDGISSLFDCVALEDLLLRHNGPGIQQNFVKHAASKIPMLRKISLDMCDARDGDFDIPDFSDRYFLSHVKISRCKFQRCSLDLHNLGAHRTPVHKETLILVWDSKRLTRTVVKERL